MPWYTTTLNNKLYILRTANSVVAEATRDQVEAWITNLAEPTLSYTRDSNNVTFTLNFTPKYPLISTKVLTAHIKKLRIILLI